MPDEIRVIKEVKESSVKGKKAKKEPEETSSKTKDLNQKIIDEQNKNTLLNKEIKNLKYVINI